MAQQCPRNLKGAPANLARLLKNVPCISDPSSEPNAAKHEVIVKTLAETQEGVKMVRYYTQIVRMVDKNQRFTPTTTKIMRTARAAHNIPKYVTYPIWGAIWKNARDCEKANPLFPHASIQTNAQAKEIDIRNRLITLIRIFCLARTSDIQSIRLSIRTEKDDKNNTSGFALVLNRKAHAAPSSIIVPWLKEEPRGLNPGYCLNVYTYSLRQTSRRCGTMQLYPFPATHKQFDDTFDRIVRNVNGKVTCVPKALCQSSVAYDRSLTTDTIAKAVSSELNKWGWDTKVFKPHALKGAIATHLMRQGMDLASIAQVADTRSMTTLLSHYIRADKTVTAAKMITCEKTSLRVPTSDINGKLTKTPETTTDSDSDSDSSDSDSDSDSSEAEAKPVKLAANPLGNPQGKGIFTEGPNPPPPRAARTARAASQKAKESDDEKLVR